MEDDMPTPEQSTQLKVHQIADAQEILGNPGQFPELRHQFPDHWAILKLARGQTVNMDRITPETKTPLALRILAHAKSLGRPRPQPLILTGATAPHHTATLQIGA